MLLGLNGRLKSGKDTTYGVIKSIYPHAEQISFAAPLKKSAAASIGISVERLEELKGREDLLFTCYADDEEIEFNVRQYLQWYGTEGHREIFGDNFWVDQALPLDLDHEHRVLVVTDMRFPNEVERVKKLGGVCVKVVREVATSHSNHPSEQNVDSEMDYFLDNTGSLQDLHKAVVKMLSILPTQPLQLRMEMV